MENKDIEQSEDVRLLVDSFYDRVRKDDVLGPVFNTIISDWSHHLPILYRFWETILLGTGGYAGQVIAKHISVNQRLPLGEAHFGRWIQLWEETVTRLFAGPRASEALKRAHLMMQLIRLKLDAHRPGRTLA